MCLWLVYLPDFPRWCVIAQPNAGSDCNEAMFPGCSNGIGSCSKRVCTKGVLRFKNPLVGMSELLVFHMEKKLETASLLNV